MNMHTISNKSPVTKSSNSASNMNLRSGQMIAGKVIEIFPNQKARIQIGGMQVVAQLETALSAKQGYIFQVVSTANTLHLKKVSDVSLESSQSLEKMLQQLGVSLTKSTEDLFSQLISKNIPFTKDDAQMLTQFLDKYGGNSSNRDILMSMMEKKLPLTDQVFRALQGMQQSGVGKEMNTLLKQLNSLVGQQSNGNTSQLTNMILDKLNQFLGTSPVNSSPLLTKKNSEVLFQLLQRTGQVNSDAPLEKFQTLVGQMTGNKTEFTQYFSNTNNHNPLPLNKLEELRPVIAKILPMLTAGDAKILQNSLLNSQMLMDNNQSVSNILLKTSWESSSFLTPIDKAMMQQFTKEVLQTHIQDNMRSLLQAQLPFNHNDVKRFNLIVRRLGDGNQPANMIQDLKNMFTSSDLLPKLTTVISKHEIEVIQRWIQNSASSVTQNQQVAELLQKVNLQQLSQQEANVVREFMLKTDQMMSFDSRSVKDHFVTLVKQFIHTSGIQDEVQLVKQSEEQENFSLKQLLIQGTQQNTDIAGDKMMRLINTLTGTQLQMLNQDQSLSQINLHFPGDKFGLIEDIRIQFEGKKKEDSKEIDPDYCRVLFHLNLNNLGETMIAMSIQKRVVHLSVYNDHEEIKPVLSLFKPLLKEKLVNLNYQLTTVTWKSFQGMNEENPETRENNPYVQRRVEGIDYRV
ncbi:hypothetical protein [Gracilibacillus xinjiangensis]|uniref:Flagellar hook-length control protein-like C-terminal domain-containing protein n=1 Tax=Gracilibacillus xinjiangensis TaxID=1193282 RepID=A0ABV8X142_9BACI